MLGAKKDVTIRKRQQIDKSKKMMFAFIASSAFLAGTAIVMGIFLLQQILFHSKIIIEKQNTLSVLDKNIGKVDELKKNIRVLDTDTNLNSVRSSDESKTLQVILDALPDNPNADALGASIKNKFIDTIGGLTIESMLVGNPGGDGADDGDAKSGSEVPFSIEVSGSADKLKELLTKFEKSIRVIELKSFEISTGENSVSLSMQGVAYYEPAQKVQLEKKVVKP